MNLGDIPIGQTLDFIWTTSVSGVPTTLAGTPSLAVYAAGSATEITAGCTLTVDYDTKTGNHRIQVAATTGNGYATGTDYTIALMAGTVGGITVAPRMIATFSIQHRYSNPTDLLDLSDGIETGLTLRQAMRLIAAASAGTLSGAASTTIVIRNAKADSKARITATVDADGNRTAITTDLT